MSIKSQTGTYLTWWGERSSGCNARMEGSGQPPPLPSGVEVRRSGAGVDCATTCAFAGQACEPHHFAHVNRCVPTDRSSCSRQRPSSIVPLAIRGLLCRRVMGVQCWYPTESVLCRMSDLECRDVGRGGSERAEWERLRPNAKLIYLTPSLIGMGLTHIPPIKPGWQGINSVNATVRM